MRCTDLVVVNERYRFYRKALTLAQSAQKRLAWYQKHSLAELRHVVRVEKLVDKLHDFARLDINEFKPDTRVNDYFIPKELNMPVKDVLDEVFDGLAPPSSAVLSDSEQALVEVMTDKGRKARAGLFSWLMKAEVAYRTHQGWFLVFDTLTVDDDHYNEVFDPASRVFESYIGKVRSMAAAAAFGSVRKAKGEDYYSYFAVVEAGGTTGRLHIHVLHFLKAVPEELTCPNIGRVVPDKRELLYFKTLWEAGFSVPIAVRYSLNDAWAKIGFRWPIDQATGKGLKANPPAAVAGYVSKYISKSYASEERSEFKWRVRKSRALGLSPLRMVMTDLRNQTIKDLMSYEGTLKMFGATIPPQLVRQMAMREFQDRQSLISLFEIAKDVNSRPSLLQQWRDLIDKKSAFSLLSTGDLSIDVSIKQGSYSRSVEEFMTILNVVQDNIRDVSTHDVPSIRDASGV